MNYLLRVVNEMISTKDYLKMQQKLIMHWQESKKEIRYGKIYSYNEKIALTFDAVSVFIIPEENFVLDVEKIKPRREPISLRYLIPDYKDSYHWEKTGIMRVYKKTPLVEFKNKETGTVKYVNKRPLDQFPEPSDFVGSAGENSPILLNDEDEGCFGAILPVKLMKAV